MSSPVPLPPCFICEGPAAGIHYGVNTCQACKRFFWRCLKKKPEEMCDKSGNCEVTLGNRNACTPCRYQKCLASGMSVKAIKQGRRRSDENTRLFLQSQKHRNKKRQPLGKHYSNSDTSSENSSDSNDVVMMECTRVPSVPDTQSPETIPETNPEPSPEPSPEALASPQTSEAELEEIIQTLKAVYLKQKPRYHEFFAELPQREIDYLANKKLEKDLFELNPIDLSELEYFDEITGIDSCGRRALVQDMIPIVEEGIRRFIAFAKGIPGFKDFPMEDQIALIRVGRFENWVLSAHATFNVEHELYTPYNGKGTYHKDDIGRMRGPDWADDLFRLVRRIQNLNLDLEETVIACSFGILLGDQCELQRPDLVSACRDKLMECLMYLLRKNHEDSTGTFVKFVSVLTEMRTLGSVHLRGEEQLSHKFQDIEFPQLCKEFWDKK